MEPLPTHLHDKVTTNGRSKPHIIYRRAANLDKRQALNAAKEKREIHTCGTEGNTFLATIISFQIALTRMVYSFQFRRLA